jgi:hypothetical protein
MVFTRLIKPSSRQLLLVRRNAPAFGIGPEVSDCQAPTMAANTRRDKSIRHAH